MWCVNPSYNLQGTKLFLNSVTKGILVKITASYLNKYFSFWLVIALARALIVIYRFCVSVAGYESVSNQ
jgi:hypothetical protein